MQKKIKILHVFGKMDYGGAELRTMEIMENINREKYQFDFLSLSGEVGKLDDKIITLGGNVYHSKLKSKDFKKNFKKILKENQYDIVHSHVHYSSGYILKEAFKQQIPKRIAHFRNTNDGAKKTFKRIIQESILKKWIEKYSTNILAVSEGAMEVAWGEMWSGNKKCQVIYNGIKDYTPHQNLKKEVYKEFNFPSNTNLYIHVGRMVKQKNHTRVIEIFSEILKIDKNAKLLMVGRIDESIKNKIEHITKNLNVEKSVILTGERSDAKRLLASSDLLIFPSLWEGLPGVVLEAVSTNTPVLASALSGVKEISHHFDSVFFLSLEKSNIEWANKSQKILINDKTKKNNRNCIKDSVFNLDYCIENFEEIWKI